MGKNQPVSMEDIVEKAVSCGLLYFDVWNNSFWIIHQHPYV